MKNQDTLTMTEASIRSLLNDPDLAFYRDPESATECYAPPPKLIGFARINGDVVARVHNAITGKIVMVGLDIFGRLAPRHSFGEVSS